MTTLLPKSHRTSTRKFRSVCVVWNSARESPLVRAFMDAAREVADAA
jgi:hypothetical protein